MLFIGAGIESCFARNSRHGRDTMRDTGCTLGSLTHVLIDLDQPLKNIR